ncbi:PqiC family protein [Ferrimonas marina]|uniref:ABC-type transport auxiliary lipoprotein component n=1 Tax=Ferrimonas marina TaxID=299255 RepID=A0A1M5YV30_9GAMM|nr:ABC-type transport auxiliary lipoprotein family protein [Ferrimonas marina]SHI15809.1 ABC-type transport auxiliary lipoprotein component [Ferrimonas marina]
MNRLLILIGLSALLCVGCSSNPSPSYHSLSDRPLTMASVSDRPGELWIEPVRLDSQVRHVGPVLMMPEGHLHLSRHQLWAAPLQDQLQRLTQESLQAALPQWQQHTSPSAWRLRIEVSRLFGSPNGEVFLTGQYSLFQGDQLQWQQSFQHQAQQDQAGYVAMTEQMRALWQQQMTVIAQQLASAPIQP